MTELLALAALGAFVSAAITDIRTRQIPNSLVLFLACLGLVRLAMDLWAGFELAAVGLDLALAGLVFLGGIALFATGLMGGGDVKLMAAASIWFGTAGTVEFLISTVLAGGVLACFFLMRRGARRLAGGPSASSADSLPYGVAIALGGVLVTLQIL